MFGGEGSKKNLISIKKYALGHIKKNLISIKKTYQVVKCYETQQFWLFLGCKCLETLHFWLTQVLKNTAFLRVPGPQKPWGGGEKISKRVVLGFRPQASGVNIAPSSLFISYFHTSFSSSSSSSFYIIISTLCVLLGLVLGFYHKFPKFKSFYPKTSSHLALSFIIFIIISGIIIIPRFLGCLTL